MVAMDKNFKMAQLNTFRRWVMKRAWDLRKTSGVDMSTALRAAWAIEKAMQAAHAQCDAEKFSVVPSHWEKYGKDRTYISINIYGKKFSKVSYGFVDNMTGAFYAA